MENLDPTNPTDWPGDALDVLFGDKDLICLTCIARPMCKRTYNDMCDERFKYYESKLKEE